ncbi:MAG: methyl-accepting chemotaxis protein [bacterium]
MEDITKKRRKPFYLIINKRFQGKFAFYFASLVFLSILFLWSTVFLVFQISIVKANAQKLLQNELQSILGTINFFFFVEGLIILGLGIFLSLVVSRSIIGPLFRIEEDLKKIQQNPEVSREIRVRRKDQFQSLVKVINDILEKLRS